VKVSTLHWYFSTVHNELITEQTLCTSAFLRMAEAYSTSNNKFLKEIFSFFKEPNVLHHFLAYYSLLLIFHSILTYVTSLM